MGAALTNARRGIVDRGGGGSPLYAQRLRGEAVRDEYSEQAGEVAALTRLAPSTLVSNMNQGQAIRDNAMAAARQQTVMHYQIRRDMANDADQAALAQDERIRQYAELALRNRTADLDALQKQQSLDLDRQQLEQQGAHQEAQLGLQEDELGLKKEEGIQDRALKEKELAAEQRRTTQQGSISAQELGLRDKEIGLREKEMTQRQGIEDRRNTVNLTRAYTGDSVAKYMESNDPADLEPRKTGSVSKTFKPAWAINRAKALGLDTSEFIDENGKRTQAAKDFAEIAQQTRADNPDWDTNKVLRSAYGDWSGGGSTPAAVAPGAPADKSSTPPPPKQAAPPGYRWEMVQGPNGWEAELVED